MNDLTAPFLAIYFEKMQPKVNSFCFPECVAKGSRFTLWGSGGWSVFAGRRFCVRALPQPYATVRNRTQESVWAKVRCASRKFHRSRHFWTFYVSPTFVSRGRRGTSWHVDVFGNVWKIIFRGRHNTFATFSKHACYFSWQAQHFVTRTQESVWGKVRCAYRKFHRSRHFWTCSVSSTFVSRGRRGTSWHVDVFGNVWKIVFRGRRNTFAKFSTHA